MDVRVCYSFTCQRLGTGPFGCGLRFVDTSCILLSGLLSVAIYFFLLLLWIIMWMVSWLIWFESGFTLNVIGLIGSGLLGLQGFTEHGIAAFSILGC